jgi:hypothetical protein
VAEALRKEPDVEVSVADGSKGEFSVSVDGEVVSSKTGDTLPPPEEVVAAVRKVGVTTGT